MQEFGLTEHKIRFTSTVALQDETPPTIATDRVYQVLKSNLKDYTIQLMSDGSISIDSVIIKVSGEEGEEKSVLVSWPFQEEELGSYLLNLIQGIS